LAEKRVHFGDRQDTARAERAVAGLRRGDRVESIAQRQRRAGLGKIGGYVAKQRGYVAANQLERNNRVAVKLDDLGS
jgi:hypothetical protein